MIVCFKCGKPIEPKIFPNQTMCSSCMLTYSKEVVQK